MIFRRTEARGHFKQTGALPPAGVTMLGRCHSVEGLRGFTIAESSDAVAVAKWVQSWTDLLTFEIVPVVNDEEFARVIA